MGLIEHEWMRLRAAEMVTADPGLSLSDAEEEAVAEWDRGMADRDARHSRGAVEALRKIAALDASFADPEQRRQWQIQMAQIARNALGGGS